jgi:hypothetical protein
MKRRRSFGMLLVVLAVVVVGFIPSSSTPTAQAANCYTNPSTVYTKIIYSSYYPYGMVGNVKLRWSVSCGTNWAQVTSTEGVGTLTGWLEIKGDTTQYVKLTISNVGQMYTDSMYGAGILIRACGRIYISSTKYGKDCTAFG